MPALIGARRALTLSSLRSLGYNPTSDASLVLWNESDKLVTVTGSGVSQWGSPLASSVWDQGTNANRPALNTNVLNGYPSIGGSTGKYLTLASAGLGIARNVGVFTMSFVVKLPATTSDKSLFGLSSGTSSAGHRIGLLNSNTDKVAAAGRRLDADSNASAASANNAFIRNTFSIWTIQFDYLNASIKHWVNGVLKLNTTWLTSGSTSDTDSQVGRLLAAANASQTTDAALVALLAWRGSATFSTTEREAREKYLSDKYNLGKKFFFCDGDSLTAGGTSVITINFPDTWPCQFNALLPNTCVYNDGVSGQTLVQMNSDAPSTIDAITLPSYTTERNLVIWGGTNDIKLGADAATTYNNLKTYLAARKATGKYTGAIVLSSIARYDTGTSTDFTPTIQAYNDLIRAGWNNGAGELATTYGVVNFIDVGADSRFDGVGDTQNTDNYQADRTHLTPTGYGIIAGLVKTALGL